jgi:hypothetical protein
VGMFDFVGGPTEGNGDEFFRRLAQSGGSPPGWKIHPHASGDGKALHLAAADTVDEVLAHLQQFGDIYENTPVIEIVERP